MTPHKLVFEAEDKEYEFTPLPELGTVYNDEEVYQLTLWAWLDLVKLEVKPLDQYDLLLTEERRKAKVRARVVKW